MDSSKSLFSDKLYGVLLFFEVFVVVLYLACFVAEAAEKHLSKQEKAEEKKDG